MRDFVVASTTDTMDDVNAAAGVVPEEPETAPLESEGEEAESPETAPAPDTGKTEKKPGKGRFSKRIDELTRERYEAQAEAARLREQLERIQTQPKPAEPAPKLAAPEGKPLRSSFTSDEDWVEAIAAWKAESLYESRQRAEREQERQQRDQSVHATYMERADQFTEQHPDFNTVIAGIRISEDVAPGVQAAIMGRPNGPEVAYYLGTHPELCEELSQMNAADAVAEVGAISIGLMPQKSSPKPAARVPEPITPVGGSSRVALDPSEMSYQQYKAWRKSQRA